MNDINNVIPSAAEGSCDIYPLPRQTPRRCSGLHTHGFTLVELAIALMVIGLLIGGVLKGQELIENARMTRTVKDINDIDTAITIFKSIYNGLPGDILHADHIPNCNDGICNETLPNNNNGLIVGRETLMFWLQLQRAGMISGADEALAITATGGDLYRIAPLNPFDTHYRVYATYGVTNLAESHPEQYHRKNRLFIGDGGSHAGSSSVLSMVRSQQLDQKMDDGHPLTGSVRIVQDEITTWGSGTLCYDETTFGWHATRAACHLAVLLPSIN